MATACPHRAQTYIPSRLELGREEDGLPPELGVPSWGEVSFPPSIRGEETKVSHAEVTSLFTVSFSSCREREERRGERELACFSSVGVFKLKRLQAKINMHFVVQTERKPNSDSLLGTM